MPLIWRYVCHSEKCFSENVKSLGQILSGVKQCYSTECILYEQAAACTPGVPYLCNYQDKLLINFRETLHG